MRILAYIRFKARIFAYIKCKGRGVSLFGSKLHCGVLYYNTTVLKRSILSKDITFAIALPHVTVILFALNEITALFCNNERKISEVKAKHYNFST